MQETNIPNGAYIVSPAEAFQKGVINISAMMSQLKAGHEQYRPNELLSEEQERAWESSLYFLSKILQKAELESDQIVLLEAIIRESRQAIDTVICGYDESGQANASLLELKTWHTSRRKGRKYDIRPLAEEAGCSNILVSLHTRINESSKEDVVSREKHRNIRLQTSDYARTIRHFLRKKDGSEKISVSSCVVLYNCTQLSQLLRETLEYNIDEQRVKSIPIVTQMGCDGSLSLDQLANRLKQKHSMGRGYEIYEKLCDDCLIKGTSALPQK
jgi:hypothetical protein